MGKMHDITNNRYNHWTVLRFDKRDGERYRWICRCDCGTIRSVEASSLKSGATKCCGCIKHPAKGNLKHGGRNERLYGVWNGMKNRCYDADDRAFKWYGGRGIKVCDEWVNDYGAFRQWALENGYDDSLNKYECTIDRINDNGDYSPDNCRFTNMVVQNNNRRSNVVITFNGESHTLKEWSYITGLNYSMLKKRYKYGWSAERMLSTPNTHKHT